MRVAYFILIQYNTIFIKYLYLNKVKVVNSQDLDKIYKTTKSNEVNYFNFLIIFYNEITIKTTNIRKKYLIIKNLKNNNTFFLKY